LTVEVNVERLENFLRFYNGQYNFGTRGTAWDAVLYHMTYRDWIFGTWLANWRSFFETYTDYKFSDPHCWVLSVMGAFGILGLIFYSYVAALLWSAARSSIPSRALVAILLLVMLFMKDLNSVQYLFNYNPVSYLIWFNLGLLLPAPASEQGAGAEPLDPRFAQEAAS
jgi:hypothetical protein